MKKEYQKDHSRISKGSYPDTIHKNMCRVIPPVKARSWRGLVEFLRSHLQEAAADPPTGQHVQRDDS